MSRRVVLVMTALTLASLTANALEPFGRGRFVREVPGTQNRVPVTEATLADKIYFQFVAALPSGDHPLQINIYDGKGQEVYVSDSTLTAVDGKAARSVVYGFNPSRDAPGTWWYVAAVNGKVVVSSSLEIRGL